MNFSQFVTGAAARAQSHQECTECFDPLCNQPVVCLCDSNNKPTCEHFFHQTCVNLNDNPHVCHLCRKLFHKVNVMPNPTINPEAWFRFVDVDNSGSLSYDEIINGLKAQIKLEWHKIELDVDNLFTKWDRDRNNSISLAEFIDPVNGVLVYLKTHYTAPVASAPIPDIRSDKFAWFKHWDEDGTNTLDKSEVCRALIKTFRLFNMDQNAVRELLDNVWCIFDSDNSGQIDINEFCSRDNLADTIIAQMSFVAK